MVIARNWKENEEDPDTLDAINVAMMANSLNSNLTKNDNLNTKVAEWKPNQLPIVDSISGTPRIVLICQPNSHPFQTRTILLEDHIEIKVGRSIARNRVAEHNAIFDCKVLSRNHAVLWYSDGKFYVKDTRSSNGTFINERRVSQSDPEELSSGDIVKFGVDVIENTRKEIHGCIIACVKLYLPDGNESIYSNNLIGPVSINESISIDELHRLYHYMQETVQREKSLKNKLQDIQNILDMTRKNTSKCWQAMVDEDRLLNRIEILESKLKFYQKKCNDDRITDDIMKLQEDKFVYQNLAKEALHKVYQERMEALQKLTTIERALCSSEDECSLLRDQLLRTQQNLQELNSRFQQIEDELNQQKQNAAEKEEESKKEVAQKLECENYQSYINELSQENIDILRPADSYDKSDLLPTQENTYSKHGPVHFKSIITKWLENSDLNNKEESANIMRAICSEPDVNEMNSSFYEEKCKNLKERLLNIESTLVGLQNNPIDGDQDDIEVLVDGTRNIDGDNNIQTVLTQTIHSLSDICQEITNYHYAVEQMKITIANQFDPEDLLFKIKTLEDEKQNMEKELETRPTLNKYEEKLTENDFLRNHLTSREQRIETLVQEINSLNENGAKSKESKESDGKDSPSDKTQFSSETKNNMKMDDNADINEELETVNDFNNLHEEELIIYKEKYEDMLGNNYKLKNEIEILKSNMNNIYNSNIIKFSTFSALCVAAFCYILVWY